MDIGKFSAKTKALEIEKWENILKKNALFVNLQYGDVSKEITYLRQKGLKIVTFDSIDYKVQLDDWLAIAGACDGLISVSTALSSLCWCYRPKDCDCYAGDSGPMAFRTRRDPVHGLQKNVRIFRPKSKKSL